MKNLITVLLIILTFVSCDKDDNKTQNPVSQLPAATQVGANKVGCLLDGVAFLHGNEPNSTNCFYQFVAGFGLSLFNELDYMQDFYKSLDE